MKIFVATCIQGLFFLLPWGIRRRLLNIIFNHSISKSAHIGFSIILAKRIEMHAKSRIGHFTIIKGASLIVLNERSSIGNLNWIFAFPIGTKSQHFHDQPGRSASLVLGRHSAITARHILDCTDSIKIGEFSTVAGYRTQFLTHSINLRESRQKAECIEIGKYCFIGTGCILLPGASLPDFCVLGAGSVLTKKFKDSFSLYSGTPAIQVRSLENSALYFHRTQGFII